MAISKNLILSCNNPSDEQVSLPKSDSIGRNFKNVQLSISGVISDSNGIPLPGANVIEKGTINVVAADFEGQFSITFKDNDAILVVSY